MAHLWDKPNTPYLYVRYTDAGGNSKAYSTRTRDRRAARAILAEFEKKQAQIRAGVFDEEDEQFARECARPISEHVEAFHQQILDRGSTTKHAKDSKKLVEVLIEQMGISRVDRLQPSRVLNSLEVVRARGELSIRWKGKALRALKQFTRFLVADLRLERDPIGHLKGFNVEGHRKRERRELTDEELGKLIAAAQHGQERYGLSGEDRAMLYRLALATGLRASELASLTRSSFDLEARKVTVGAAYSKRRRTDVLNLPLRLSEALAPWLSRRTAKALLFDVKRLSEKTARMIRADLGAAEIVYEDEDGKVADFHALRHAFVSRLTRTVDAAVAQKMARHSTPELTLARYSHPRSEDQDRALDAVDIQPASEGGTETAVATGTASDCTAYCTADSSTPAQGGAAVCSSGDSPSDDTDAHKSAGVADVCAPVQSGAAEKSGTPARTRTWNLRIRNPLLGFRRRVG